MGGQAVSHLNIQGERDEPKGISTNTARPGPAKEGEDKDTNDLDKEEEPNSGKERIAKMSTLITSTHDKALLQEVNEPQRPKEGVKSAMKSDKRADKAGPNMILYDEIICHHQGEETTEIETKLSLMFLHQE